MDVLEGMLCFPSAICCRTHACQRVVSFPGAGLCVPRNTSYRKERALHSRGVYMVYSDDGAWSLLPGKTSLAEVSVSTDLVVIHIQQAQLLDDTSRSQIVVRSDPVLDLTKGYSLSTKALD